VSAPNAVDCGTGCLTPNQLCASRGFTGATAAYAYFLGQCSGPGDCPVGWTGLTCADWCSGADCVGNGYCGPAYVVIVDTPSPDQALCPSDHGGNCAGDAPGYFIRASCF
jgi:hypothetical protein